MDDEFEAAEHDVAGHLGGRGGAGEVSLQDLHPVGQQLFPLIMNAFRGHREYTLGVLGKVLGRKGPVRTGDAYNRPH